MAASLTHRYRTVKNFGSKKVWQIRTVGSLAENLWQNEVHFAGNVMEIVKIGKKLEKCCNLPNLPKLFLRQCF